MSTVLVPGKLYVLKDNPLNLWGFISNNYLTFVSIKQIVSHSLPNWKNLFNEMCDCFLCLEINTYQSIKNDYDVTDYIEYKLLSKNRIFTCNLERIKDKDFFDDWISI